MKVIDQNFCIYKKDKAACLAALKAAYVLFTFDGLLVPVDGNKLQLATTLETAMAAWGWPPMTDAEGDIVGVVCKVEKYKSSDIPFMQTIAPFVDKDSFLFLEGEDGEFTKWHWDASGFHETQVVPPRDIECEGEHEYWERDYEHDNAYPAQTISLTLPAYEDTDPPTPVKVAQPAPVEAAPPKPKGRLIRFE